MERKQKVILYGIGAFGKKIVCSIDESKEEMPFEIVAYMDKDKKEYLGHDIVKPESISGFAYDFIAITSEKYYEDIRRELVEKHHVADDKIISWRRLAEGTNYCCNLCGKTASFFFPSGTDLKLFKHKNVTGGGERANSLCPFCKSMDRFRWFQHILETQTDIYTKESRILHFAPEGPIADKIRQKNPDYITADIMEGAADVREDLTNLSFADETFDYIIFNHVLEHIKEEEKAMKEVMRCIKPAGKIILSVPICWEEETFESDEIVTAQEREKYYGQGDHVRLYGNDFQKRMEAYGFTVRRYSYHENQYGENIRKMALLENDTIWILSKKEN